MEQLVVLGTGNAAATKCYNTCFALQKDEEYFLVDTGGGNGILRALELADIGLHDIHNIFITHEHTDHILGIVWLVRMIGAKMNQDQFQGTLTIYCHSELEHTIRTMVMLTVQKKFYQYFDSRIVFKIVEDGETVSLLGYAVTFFDIGSTKAKQFGFQLTLNDGKKLTCAGDEPYKEVIQPYMEGCHWLLHEAFCLYKDRDIYKPYEKHHSTVKEACELASRFGIDNLVLWHTEDRNLHRRKEYYSEEGKQYYKGNLHIPNDLEIISLT